MSEEIRDVAVLFLNTEGLIMSGNRGADDMKGYTAQEAIGSLRPDEQKAQSLVELHDGSRPAGRCRSLPAGGAAGRQGLTA